jgi:hypothetical protein
MTSFWFKKNELTRVTRSKPGTRVLDRTGSKNYDFLNISLSSAFELDVGQ